MKKSIIAALFAGVSFLFASNPVMAQDAVSEAVLTAYEKLPELRAECGDRAVLRAMHFYGENTRVQQQIAALKKQMKLKV